jgi:iron-sulfur cluster repair protein YtfE (RIC family)
MKATDLLKKDHDAVRGLLSEFEDSNDRSHQKRSALAQQICSELKVHAAIEEEIFYPAVKALRNKDAKFDVEEALHEHKQIKAAVAEISRMEPGDEPALGATMKVLKEDVEHHADEEEKEMFKEARKMGNSRLEELGEKLQSRKDQLKAAASVRKAG